jgi:hypothetical protein
MLSRAQLCVRAFLGALLNIAPCRSFLHPSLVIDLFVTPPIKLKQGQKIGGKVQKINHGNNFYNGPIKNTEQ